MVASTRLQLSGVTRQQSRIHKLVCEEDLATAGEVVWSRALHQTVGELMEMLA